MPSHRIFLLVWLSLVYLHLFSESRNKSVAKMHRRAGVYVCISAG